MTFEEALKALREGKKIRRKDWCEGFFITLTSNKCLVVNGRTSGLFIDDFSEDWWEEVKEDILDKEEKEYLSAVIKPFRDRITHIRKMEIDDHKQYICIKLKKYNYNDYDIEISRYEHIALPNFEKNTMYKNMKADKEYTLKELGL